jgi:hypothetical protein
MKPALHCRIDLTKIGTWRWLFEILAGNFGREQKPRRESALAHFPIAPDAPYMSHGGMESAEARVPIRMAAAIAKEHSHR